MVYHEHQQTPGAPNGATGVAFPAEKSLGLLQGLHSDSLGWASTN